MIGEYDGKLPPSGFIVIATEVDCTEQVFTQAHAEGAAISIPFDGMYFGDAWKESATGEAWLF